MSERLLTLDFSAIQRSTRRSMAVSTAVHAAVLLLLIFSHRAASESAGLTEISWEGAATMEPEPAGPPVAPEEARSARVEEVKMQVARAAETTEHFERPLERADVAPQSQTRAVADILSDKIDAMERDGTADRTKIASLVAPPKVGVPSLAGVKTAGGPPSGNPNVLSRGTSTGGGGGSGPPAVLQRTGGGRAGIPIAAVPVAMPPAGKTGTAAPATSTSSRNLAGAQLVGPVADRPLVSYQVPRYPEWAKRDGVEGSVTLYFFVLPDGRIKENIVVERTSGFSDFDTGAVEALRQWKFQALPGSGEQWGRITFNYRLSDTQ
jgi:TonB family protein